MPSKSHLLIVKVTFMVAWLLCSIIVTETEIKTFFPRFYIMDVQQRQKYRENKFYHHHWELFINSSGISSSLHSKFYVTQTCSLLLCSCWPASKTSYCTAVSWTSANTIGPYQYKWISRETYLFPVQASACKQCVHGSSQEASREGHRSTVTSVWESVSTGRHKHHHTR